MSLLSATAPGARLRDAIIGPPLVVGAFAYGLARARSRRARERLEPNAQPI